MASIVGVVVHPSQSHSSPRALLPLRTTISGAGKQVLVISGIREHSNLAEAMSAMKASFPDAHAVVAGNATKPGNVTTALELGATRNVT
jgi:hypothetical protein